MLAGPGAGERVGIDLQTAGVPCLGMATMFDAALGGGAGDIDERESFHADASGRVRARPGEDLGEEFVDGAEHRIAVMADPGHAVEPDRDSVRDEIVAK